MMPSLLDKRKDTVPMGFFWKFARVGERLSPYVSICCVAMAVRAPGVHNETSSRLTLPRST